VRRKKLNSKKEEETLTNYGLLSYEKYYILTEQ